MNLVPYGLHLTQFSLHTIMCLLSFYRSHSQNSLVLRSKENVQLLMHFSEVTQANSSKTSTALNKGTLGFVRAKCITKQQPFRYKNTVNKQKQMYNSKFIVQTITSYKSWLQHSLLILNLTPKSNVVSYNSTSYFSNYLFAFNFFFFE